jgi:hypothetical protein
MSKFPISRQVTRREKQLDDKALRRKYDRTFINAIRYEPAEYRGKKYPFGSERQGHPKP